MDGATKFSYRTHLLKYLWIYLSVFSLVVLSLSLLVEPKITLAFIAGLVVLAITPLVANRYFFFLFLWLFIVPLFDNLGGGNPAVLLITGISLPFALYMIVRDYKEVSSCLPFVPWFMLFLVVLFFNLFRFDAVPEAKGEFVKFFIMLFVIYCSYHLVKQQKELKLINIINGFMILNSSVGLFQRFTGIGLRMIEGVPRIAGLSGHPAVLGFLNVLYLPFAIFCLLKASSSKEKVYWLVGIVTSTLALLLSLSKTVYFSLLLNFITLLFFLPAKQRDRIFSYVLIFAVVLILINWGAGLHLEDSFLNRLENTSSWEWRQKIWGWLLYDVNWVTVWFGHGISSAQTYLQSMQFMVPYRAHNGYIQLLYELGLTSCTFYFIFGSLTAYFIRFWNSANIFPLLMILSIFVNLAADNSVFLRTPMNFAWVFFVYFMMSTRDSLKRSDT